MASLEERFWAKVDRRGPEECWPWLASRYPEGYGRIGVRGAPGGNDRAHRISLKWALGRPIRAGYEACHRCDNPPCVNPAHLYEGTHAENMADMIRQGKGIARPHLRGFGHPSARLTAADVERIRAADLSQYGSRISLARSLGVTAHTIYAIRVGKLWPHATGGQ